MKLPAQNQDVWTQATEGDKLKALASLAGLPSRVTSSAERDEATFFVALDNVTRWSLFEAVRMVLQNALGHGFFPSPPELRGLCDKAMEHHREMRRRIERREKMRINQPRTLPPLTDEEKARQAARKQAFDAWFSGAKADEGAERVRREREEIRARYGMADEAI